MTSFSYTIHHEFAAVQQKTQKKMVLNTSSNYYREVVLQCTYSFFLLLGLWLC